MPPAAVSRLTASAVAVLVCAVSACSSGPADVMATSTCPDPLHRILVTVQSSAPGPIDQVGRATPSPSIDPAEQHPLSATAVFHPDGDPV